MVVMLIEECYTAMTVIWIWDTTTWKFDNMSGIFVFTFFSFSPFDFIEQDISVVILFFFLVN